MRRRTKTLHETGRKILSEYPYQCAPLLSGSPKHARAADARCVSVQPLEKERRSTGNLRGALTAKHQAHTSYLNEKARASELCKGGLMVDDRGGLTKWGKHPMYAMNL